MARFTRLPVKSPQTHVIIDGGRFIQDKEYVDLGLREGWLNLYRIIHEKDGSSEYQYTYPDSYSCE